MNKKQQFGQLFDLPDDESYAGYLKLSPDERIEYEKFVIERAERFKTLTMDANVKLMELEEQLKQKDEEYRRLLSLHQNVSWFTCNSG